MSDIAALEAEIRRLEERLLTPEVRAAPEELARLLADDFLEFGSSGRVFDRQQVIATLPLQPKEQLALTEFQVRLLAPTIALAMYRVARPGEQQDEPPGSLRSSIWRYTAGRWQMVFHQGTPITRGSTNTGLERSKVRPSRSARRAARSFAAT